MYLSQEQHEVSDAFGTAARRLVQGQLEEREGEAPGETEVGDGTQRWETRGARHPVLGQHPPPGPQPSIPSTCSDREGWTWMKGKKMLGIWLPLKKVQLMLF